MNIDLDEELKKFKLDAIVEDLYLGENHKKIIIVFYIETELDTIGSFMQLMKHSEDINFKGLIYKFHNYKVSDLVSTSLEKKYRMLEFFILEKDKRGDNVQSCKSCKGVGLINGGGYAVDCKILSKLKDLVDYENFCCSEYKER